MGASPPALDEVYSAKIDIDKLGLLVKSIEEKRDQSFLIHAINVHQGGGRTLLNALLSLPLKSCRAVLLDARMSIPSAILDTTTVIRVRPSIPSRLLAECRLRAIVRPGDTILCFGNLPPLFNVVGRVVVFVQNRYLIEDVSLRHLTIKNHLRLRIERAWLRMRARIVDEFIVQTPSMKDSLVRYLSNIKTKPGHNLRIQSFVSGESQSFEVTADGAHKTPVVYDFIYVASGEFHKNHRRLIEAWILLAQEGYYPSLLLTLDIVEFSELCDWIESQKQIHNLRIDNKGLLPASQITDFYKCSSALIYPSTLESLGLPLIEARNAGLAVLAGELNYVRDILNPDETFDPSSAISIARSVKRFMYTEEPPLQFVDVSTFVASLFHDSQKPEV